MADGDMAETITVRPVTIERNDARFLIRIQQYVKTVGKLTRT